MIQPIATRTTTPGQARALEELLSWFKRCGYIRRYDPARRKQERSAYRKGYEVRFALRSEAEIREVETLLRKAGIRPGAIYRKFGRFVQPVYGRAFFEWLLGALPKSRARAALGFGPDARRLRPRPPRRGAQD